MFTDPLFARLLSRAHHYHLSIEGDDNPGAGGAAGGEGGGGGASTAGAGAADAVDVGTSSVGSGEHGSGVADLTDDAGAATAPANWPDDWRERLAGGDDAALRNLKRFGSVEGLWKKIVNQEKLLSDRSRHQGALPENATEEQIAAYRLAIGVPEAADGYGLRFDPGLKVGDTEKAMLDRLQAHAFAANVPKSQLDAVFGWYQQEMARDFEERARVIEQARAKQVADLRREFGAEKNRNLTITEEFLEQHGIGGILDAVLPSGLPVKFDPMFRRLIALARDNTDEEALYSGDADSGGKSIDEQIAAYRTKSVSGKLTAAEDKRYMDLLAARERRNAKRQPPRAA